MFTFSLWYFQVFKYLDRSHHYADDKIDDNWMHKIRNVKEVLDGLRTKRTNVLIATSVVEEGVDVDACSFVIVFDHIKSTKAYVQMKGTHSSMPCFTMQFQVL
jgi:superfamily II DNA or RNA helicase